MVGGASNRFRISGIATGMDTESMVKQLMQVEKMPLNKIVQKKQIVEWKRDDYRDITNTLRGFRDEFFDIAKPDKYILSKNTFKQYQITSSDDNVVSATGTYSAISGTNTVKVNRLATQASVKGNAGAPLTQELTATAAYDFSAISGKSLKITVDGTEREIQFDATITDVASFQQELDTLFGANKIQLTDNAGILTIEPALGSGVQNIIIDSNSNALTDLGFGSNTSFSNRINTSLTLDELTSVMNTAFTFVDDKLSFTINGKAFEFDKTDTLASVITTVNSDADAKVEMKYDEITDTFKMIADEFGAGQTLDFSDGAGGNFFSAIGLDVANVSTGIDAEIEFNGELITRSSNTFNVSGVNYTIKQVSATTQTIKLDQNVDAIYEKVSTFVEKYNELLEKINGKLSEERDRDYLPLSDDDKEAMSEEQIEKWEEKAKSGLLRNDSILENIVSKMRRALQDTVGDISGVLADIGITTTGYKDKGKLQIDETKLKNAIRDNSDKVMNMLSKSSETYSGNYRTLTSNEKSVRYSEEGMLYRIFDIVEENISTYRNASGERGVLLEKAGITGESSEYDNIMFKQLYDYEEEISDFWDRLYKKEESYYAQFTAMETAISKMNSQFEWFASQLGGTTG